MYAKHRVYLSKFQVEKLTSAIKNKKSVSLRIDPSIRANHDLYLTPSQIKKLKTGTHDITLSKTQLSKNGGFIISIPALMAGLSAAAGLATAGSAIAKTVQEKKHQKRQEAETKRHNTRVENLLRASGKGVFIPKMLKKKK